jgi:hypothetical protein
MGLYFDFLQNITPFSLCETSDLTTPLLLFLQYQG